MHSVPSQSPLSERNEFRSTTVGAIASLAASAETNIITRSVSQAAQALKGQLFTPATMTSRSFR